MSEELSMLPPSYKEDIEKAIEILKNEGCKDIYLFGSLTKGNIKDGSDIDLAIKGCPSGKYFNLIGRLMVELDHSVDLVNLDKDEDFASFLDKEGELVYVS